MTPAVLDMARQYARSGLAVLPGIELTTAEEVHILGLFEAGADLGPFQAEVFRNLPDLPAKQKYSRVQPVSRPCELWASSFECPSSRPHRNDLRL